VKVERESVTKIRYAVEGDMTNPRVSVDVVTDNKSTPIALKFAHGIRSRVMSIKTAKSVIAVLTAAVEDAEGQD
jgi:hypothetical protein